MVYLDGGRTATPIPTLEWVKYAYDCGAGEILLTSMNHDGTKNGFALDITRAISELVDIPIIASGGAGNMQHFADVFTEGKADAALAASIFHFNEIPIPSLKEFLAGQQIPVRLL
jgi:cyclase